MCGICGAAWTDSGRPLEDAALGRMMETLRPRGPDDAGTYRDTHAALGFRRLSILDLAGGHQPLANEDGSVQVVFNGEIYNFPELRRRLEARGHSLRSSGDTEVLVHLYEDLREQMLPLLRGMFALAIWDAARRRLLLARDRLGQKPLLYRVEPDRILFASELKALLALPEADVPRRLDPIALDHYLAYGYVPHPRTILQTVHKLPPAHYAIWQQGRLSLDRYWTPDWNVELRRSEADDAEALRSTLDDAVREQMVADVPLGAFLSGGIDSTIIVGLMQRHSHQPVKTFSIGFDDPSFDESRYAELAARHLGTEHHAFRVEPRAWETLPALAGAFDEPFADSSALPTWFVARQTRQHVTVALTGDAGDELFGGYDRYRALALTNQLGRLPGGARRILGTAVARAIPASARAKTRLRAARRLLEGLHDPAPLRYLRWMTLTDESARLALYSPEWLDLLSREAESAPDADPASILQRAWDAAPLRDDLTRAMIADILTYLPGDLLHKVDMASMAHSLECRSPFLDHRLVELALAMPVERKLRLRRGRSKVILKRAFADLLPPAIRTRAKMGFGVPIDRWFRGPLRHELRAVLLDNRSVDRGLFRRAAVEKLLADHEAGRRDHAYRLWSLLVLELWFRHQVER
ncbi:MAG: asparagine synthetase B [Isosphaeraceae bacterium]|jgi:asparagine synthase (glutamine-hydrolysing)|nr:MAG: asparagine synthetase B [Isosphaeraceae bacterium]